MPVYKCSFPAVASGLSVTVRDLAGTTVSSGTLGTASSGAVTHSFEVADGTDTSRYTGTVSSALLGTITSLSVYDVTDTIADAPGAAETGDGPPVADPTTLDPGTQYVDSTSGALYMVILNPDGPIEEWNLVGGEVDGVNEVQGVILGNGITVVGKSVNGTQAFVGDVDSYNDSGNGIYWAGTGTDGGQSFKVRVGDGEVLEFALYNDGYADFPGTIKAAGPVGTTAAEPGDGSVNSGECFMWFDSANGAASVNFKGKTLNGTVVEATVAMS